MMNSPFIALAAYYIGSFATTSVALWVIREPEVLLLCVFFLLFAPDAKVTIEGKSEDSGELNQEK